MTKSDEFCTASISIARPTERARRRRPLPCIIARARESESGCRRPTDALGRGGRRCHARAAEVRTRRQPPTG